MAPSIDAREGGRESEVAAEDVLYDDHRDRHYVAIAVSDDGITLRRRDTEYYVPHTIFAEWYDSGRIVQGEDAAVETPEWIDDANASEP